MPKPIVNNLISYQNSYGRIIQHGEYLNQGVKSIDSPTFANVNITGDAIIEGNLYVEGNTTLLDSNVIAFQDNIIVINRLETGSGVTLNQAGLEVERGTLENFRFVYHESDGSFRVGPISTQQPVATREDVPLPNGIMTWNSSSKRVDSTNSVSIDIGISSTTNATSSTSGALKISGGIGVSKDAHVDGRIYLTGSAHANKSSLYTSSTNNSLYITSPQDINLVPSSRISIPYNVQLFFGATTQSISANSANNNVDIRAGGDVNFNVKLGQKITVPNRVPITFSTVNEKVYTDDSNNMVIEGSQDINLVPGLSKKVLIPFSTPLAFGNNAQYIFSSILNDLNIACANNINLTPGATLNVCLPTDNGIKFGTSGLQRMFANSANELFILSSNTIHISSGSRVAIPSNTPLTFGSVTENIKSNTSGNVIIDSINGVLINTTKNSSGIDSGALIVNGGVGISRDLHVGGDLVVYGNTVTLNTETLLVEDNIIVVNNTPISGADGGLLVRRFSDGVSATIGNIYAGIVFKEQSDEFVLAYAATAANLTLTTTDYIPLRANGLKLMDPTSATTFSSASLSVMGGAYLHKNLIVNEDVTASNLVVTQKVQSQSLRVFNQASIGSLLIHSSMASNSVSTGSVVVNGGVGIMRNLFVGGASTFTDTTVSSGVSSGAVMMHGGLSIMCSTNATTYGNGGGLSIAGGMAVTKDFYLGGRIFSNTTASFSNVTLTSSSGNALMAYGGINILQTSNAVGVGSGGALSVEGGMAVTKDLYVGGQLFISNLSIDNTVKLPGNGFQTIINNTNGSTLWVYMGALTGADAYFDITFANGIDKQNYPQLHGMRLIGSKSGTSASFAHSFVGDPYTANDQRAHVYIYSSTSASHMFVKVPENSQTFINVTHQLQDIFSISYEGLSTTPNGSFSGYNGTWTLSYTTNNQGSLNYEGGNVVANTKLITGDNLPLIAKNNDANAFSRDAGVMLQRYQNANDSGLGDVVNKSDVILSDTLPNQTSTSLTQIRLSNAASSVNNYYNGMWVKVTSGLRSQQVRRIVSYNGSLRVAELESEWTSSNPVQNDTVQLFGSGNVAAFYDESLGVFRLSYTSKDTQVQVEPDDDVGFMAKNIVLSSSVDGVSVLSHGDVVINSTSNSMSITEGGSLTSQGGGSFKKTLTAGEKIVIGDLPSADGDIHISKAVGKVKLQNDTSSYSFIEFTEKNTQNRFGLISNNSIGQMSLTCATNGSSPLTANKSITISSSGFVGIGTTSNINSMLTIEKNNNISISGNDGYLGINACQDNTNGAKMLLFGASHATQPGNLRFQTATTSGSLIFENNNIERIRMSANGDVSMSSTTTSTRATSAALVVNGGVSIAKTSNSISVTEGGALTIAGGMAIAKDIYVGGALYIDGSLTVGDFTSTPVLTFNNTIGCSIVSYGNNKLIKLNNEAILTFYVDILPNAESQNCQFELSIPDKSTHFTNRGDVIISCSGYTDDTNVYTLFNILGVGVVGTTNAMIKFHSASTGVHKLLVHCRYTLS
jgi:hypothetical protein